MNDSILKLSQSLRESIKPLANLQKNAEFDDKLVISEVLEKLMDAQGLIAELQSGYQEILESKENLQKQVKEYETWKENESQYESFRFISGATVVITKSGDKSPYAKEWYCKHCFDNKKKSLLQAKLNNPSQYHCHACDFSLGLMSRDMEAYSTANQK